MGRYVSSAPIFIAIEKGYFRREGIEIQLTDLGTQTAMAGIAGGDVDVYGGTIFIGMFNAMLRGQAVQIVADKGHADGACSDYALMARPAVLQPGASIAGTIRGRRVSMRKSSIDEFIIDTVLTKAGLTKEDIRIVNVPGNATVAAFKSDQVDIRFCGEPSTTHLISDGTARPWLTMQQVAPGMQYAVLAYGPRLLGPDRALGHRVMRAYLAGVRTYNEGKTAGNVEIVSRYTSLDPELVRQMCWPAVRPDGEVDEQSLRNFLGWSRAAGYLDGEVPAGRYWDAEFVRAAR